MSQSLALRLTDAAEADLAELWAYIALESSEDIATRFLQDIGDVLAVLLHSPLIGPKREMFGSDLRVTFHRSYAIYYRPTAKELVIIRVLHGARDAEALAERGDFA